MIQTINTSSLWNQILRVTSSWFTTYKSNYAVVEDDYLIFDSLGLVWTKERSRLLRMSVEAAKQGWCNKANAYIGELAFEFGLDTYNLTSPLSESMQYFGYSEQEIKLIRNWINGYRTGINNYIQTNKSAC